MQGSTKPDLVCEAEFNLTTAQLVLVTPLISLQLVSVVVTCHCTVGGVGVPVALAVNVAVVPELFVTLAGDALGQPRQATTRLVRLRLYTQTPPRLLTRPASTIVPGSGTAEAVTVTAPPCGVFNVISRAGLESS